MNVAQGGLPSRSDHERALARPVAEDPAARPPQVLRLRARLRRPSLGKAGPAHLPRSLQTAQCRATQLHHGWRQTRNRY